MTTYQQLHSITWVPTISQSKFQQLSERKENLTGRKRERLGVTKITYKRSWSCWCACFTLPAVSRRNSKQQFYPLDLKTTNMCDSFNFFVFSLLEIPTVQLTSLEWVLENCFVTLSKGYKWPVCTATKKYLSILTYCRQIWAFFFEALIITLSLRVKRKEQSLAYLVIQIIHLHNLCMQVFQYKPTYKYQ